MLHSSARGAQALQKRSGLAEVIEQQVRPVVCQFGTRVPAGGDSNGTRADGTRAAHVERRVADDPDSVTRDVALTARAHRRQRFASDIVPVEMVVAETAEREIIVEAEVAQLKPGAGADVASQ